MRLGIVFIVIAICMSARAQDHAPQLVRTALHCLVTERNDLLGLHKTRLTTLHVGYSYDNKSYPGEKHLYIAVYSTPDRAKGKIYDFQYRLRNSEEVFDLQNNGAFSASAEGIRFTEPPLGGTWTHTHLKDAIRKARRRPAIILDVANLVAPAHGAVCKSYAEDN